MIVAAMILAAAAGLGASGVQAQPAKPTVTARVDRPAIWIADRVMYTVEIACPRGLDILVEDLGRDRLKLTGLDIVSSNTTRHQDGDLARYVADYVLTTYRVDVPAPSIGSFAVRYYATRPGQRPEEAAPEGSILVPEVAVAFRSLLPDDQPVYEARQPPGVPARWIGYRVLEPVGIGLILAAVAPVGLLMIKLVRGARARRLRAGPPSARRARQTARVELDAIRATDPADPDARRAAFARLDSLVRRHVAETCGAETQGLTPGEIAAAIGACAERIPLELVMSILSACELARYAPRDLQPSAEVWHETLGEAEQLLFAGR
jgi:hypothetical protein